VSFPAYARYKASGVEWLREVPSHWAATRLKNLLREIDARVGENDLELLGLSKSQGVVRRSELSQGASESDNYSKYKVVRSGNLVMNKMQAWNGVFGLSPHDGMISPDYSVFEVAEPSQRRFLCDLLRTDQVAGELFTRCRGMGTAFLRLNTGDFFDVRVPLPPPDEIEGIIAFVDRETAKIDALIEEQRRLIALLKEKRQAVISHAVTKGLDPHAPMKDSGIEWLGEVPAHWRVVPLKFLATVQTGLAKGKDHGDQTTVRVPYLRVANVQNGHLNLDDVAEIDVLPSDVDRYRLRIGDVLMNEGGDFDKLGRGDVWQGQIPDCLHQNHVFAVRPIRVASTWLNLVNGSGYAQTFFILRSKQTTNLASISSSNLMELPVVMPPPDEQMDIERAVSSMRSKLDELTTQADLAIGLLNERRAALISAAVTGKIDVRGSAKVLQFPIERARARALVGTEIIERSAGQPTFGRVKFQKVAFLAEGHVGISELAGCYTRAAAGPLDGALIDEMEHGANSIAGVERAQPGGSGTTNTYRLTRQRGAHRQELADWLGPDRTAKLDKLVADFADLTTKQAEAVATLYGVWNDLLSEGAEPSDDEIITGFLNDWHPEKREKFRASELPEWLGWMRRHGIVPTGSGPKTTTGRLFV